MTSASSIPTVIIGAGPFGLSIAAHLQSISSPFRIFGIPMHRWLYQMPRGMHLKSEGCASSLSEPSAGYTLARFCKKRGIRYTERDLPVSLDTFTEYALSFQRKFVPSVEQVLVSSVKQLSSGFELALETGDRIHARNVIVATGLDGAAYIPPVFTHLPETLVSHSGSHYDLLPFKDKDVTVIGCGQSALETAALLHELGARARVLARKPALRWNDPPRPENRSLYQRLRYPASNIGEGLQLWLYCAAPNLFRYLPLKFRISRIKTVLGAAGSWWLRDRIEGKIQLLTGHEVLHAEARNGRVTLRVAGPGGKILQLETDHVIAATGYQYDIRQLSFLSDELKESLRTEDHRPVVSLKFESTVPGLYFAGMATAYRFGPTMRFIAGARHTAETLVAHLKTQRGYYPVVLPNKTESARDLFPMTPENDRTVKFR